MRQELKHRNLTSERVRLGMTQEQLASELGCTVKSLWKWEKDVESMPIDMLRAASSFFGCSIDYLVDMTAERI